MKFRAGAIGLGAATQVFTLGFGRATLGDTQLAVALLNGAGWEINLTVAEVVISRGPAAGDLAPPDRWTASRVRGSHGQELEFRSPYSSPNSPTDAVNPQTILGSIASPATSRSTSSSTQSPGPGRQDDRRQGRTRPVRRLLRTKP